MYVPANTLLQVLNWHLPDTEEIRNLRDSISELKKEQRTLNVIVSLEVLCLVSMLKYPMHGSHKI